MEGKVLVETTGGDGLEDLFFSSLFSFDGFVMIVMLLCFTVEAELLVTTVCISKRSSSLSAQIISSFSALTGRSLLVVLDECAMLKRSFFNEENFLLFYWTLSAVSRLKWVKLFLSASFVRRKKFFAA